MALTSGIIITYKAKMGICQNENECNGASAGGLLGSTVNGSPFSEKSI